MKRILSMALASGLMLLGLPMMTATADDTGDTKPGVVAAAPADPTPQADPAPVETAPAPEPDQKKVEPVVEEKKADPPAEKVKAPEVPKAADPTADPVVKTSRTVEDKKVGVCKYSGTPGDDEKLQTFIEVAASTLGKDWDGKFPAEFADAQGKSVAIGWAGEVTQSDCPKADAFEPRTEHMRWLVPAEVGDPNGKTVDATFFPQPLLTTLPCGRWSQDDTYLIENKADDDLFKSLGAVLEWVNGHPEDSAIYKSHGWTYGGDCPPPLKPKVTLDYSKVCGSITLTTVNNDAVNPGWYYGLQGKVDGIRVVSAVQKGPGTKVTTKTFAEDFNGGSVTVQVMVYAATEQDLLPAEWPNLTTVVDVVVDTDCIPPQPPAEKVTGFAETCLDGGYRSDREGTQAYVLVDGKWVLGEEIVWGAWVNKWYTNDEWIEKGCREAAPETIVKVTPETGATCDGWFARETTDTTTFGWVWKWDGEAPTNGAVLSRGSWEPTLTTVVSEWVKTGKLTADEKAEFNCVAKTTPDEPNTLAFTGPSEGLPWYLGGAGLLAIAGILMVVGARRKA